MVVRESGKAAARVGRFQESRERLADARVRFTELGEPRELCDVEAAVAESYLLEGNWQEALARVDQSLEQAEVAGATVLPTLYRIRGFALLLGGDVAAAKVALEEGLALGTAPVARHEEGFLQAGLARIAALAGDPAAEQLLTASQEAMTKLGVLAAPLPN